jgi:hypothetical protein
MPSTTPDAFVMSWKVILDVMRELEASAWVAWVTA